MNRRIALLTAGWKRFLTPAWLIGMMQYIREHQANIQVEWFQSWGDASRDPDFIHGEDNIYELPELGDYDGIVVDLINMPDKNRREEVLNKIRESGVPAVSLCDDVPGMYYMSVRGYDAIRSFVLHLYEEHGCRSFHFAGGPKGNYENEQRVQAYQETLRELGLEESAQSLNYGDFDKSSGIQAVKLLSEGGKRLPDAIICANDNIAVAAVVEAEKLGYRVPQDLKVTGFDNFDKALLFLPQITTAEVRREDIGYRCVELLERIWNGETPQRVTYISPRIIYGESCGCPGDGSMKPREVLKNQIIAAMKEEDVAAELAAYEGQLHLCADYDEMTARSAEILDKVQVDGYAIMEDVRLGEQQAGTHLPENGYDHAQMKQAAFRWQLPSQEPNGQAMLDPKAAPAGTFFLSFPLHVEQYAVGYVTLINPYFLWERHDLFEAVEMVLKEITNRYTNIQLQKAVDELSRIYNRDQLTGAYARTALEKIVVPAFAKWSEENGAAVLFLDVDRFKELNDRFGHAYGDMVLKTVADVLMETLPKDAMVCRYGGDEFMAVTPCSSCREANGMGEKVLENLKERKTEASLGIAFAGKRNEDAAQTKQSAVKELEELILLSDQKMYDMKERHHAGRRT